MTAGISNYGLVVSIGLIFACGGMPTSAQTVELVNNHPFPIRMPWVVRGPGLKAADSQNRVELIQNTADGIVVLVDLPPGGVKTLDLSKPPLAGKRARTLSVGPQDGGVELSYRGKEIGRLSFAVVVQPAVKPRKGKEDEAGVGQPDFDFKPLPLSFRQTGTGPLFTSYSAEAIQSGLRLTIHLDAYHDGFLDIHSAVINENAPREDVYAAVVMKWDAKATARSVGYDNHLLAFSEDTSTPWRKGEGRHLFVQRGVDWISSDLEAGAGAVLLNDFSPSFTYHKEATAKTSAQWIGANSAQLAQEAYTQDGALYCVTELAHPTIRSYRSRTQDNILPDSSQPMSFTQRLIFSLEPLTAESADNAFVAYTSFNPQTEISNSKSEVPNLEAKISDSKSQISNPKAEIRISFGVPFTKFGTAYFPYSTLGENFMSQRLPGMSQDTYWPLAAEVVNNYQLFADDIRRDLRILKAFGFESTRLHHLEMLYAKDPAGKEYCTAGQRDAFLDFYFAELKKLGLTALLDVKLPAEEIARLVGRYRAQIDGVEIDNEVLIFGIKDEDVQSWKDIYAAVKKVAPEIPVHLTAHTNTGAFVRLDQLGVPYDRVGQHGYVDALDAMPSARGFALQAASFATKVNKPPVITEWNWRGLTRMTEEARAAVYAPIFENVLKTRCMPVMYQFQFNDSLAMNPEGLKGIRHYELLNLSRRPKAEADVFARLIETYSAPDSGPRTLKVERKAVEFKDGTAGGLIFVHNASKKTLRLMPVLEPTTGVEGGLAGKEPLLLAPGQPGSLTLTLLLEPEAPPGFYHCFIRFEDQNNQLLRYAWIEARNPGAPKIDRETKSDVTYLNGALEFDLNRPLAVVYGDNCPILELEAAWVVYQTLESATGRQVPIYTLSDLPKEAKEALIYIGTPKSLPIVNNSGTSGVKFVTRISRGSTDALLIGGSDSRNAALAAMDFTLRYWKFAKDAACRRIPLTANTTFKGPDAGQLP